MAKEGIEERRMYEIRKYNFATATGEIIETHPKKIKGLSNALRVVDELNRRLTQEEKDAGISWYRHP